jgi:hypothetical protein
LCNVLAISQQPPQNYAIGRIATLPSSSAFANHQLPQAVQSPPDSVQNQESLGFYWGMKSQTMGPVPAYVHAQDNFKRDEEGRTPLFYAAKVGDKAIVGAIIFRERGTGLFPTRLALLQNKDNQGFKAADVAEQEGHKEIADLLRSEESHMEVV